MSREKCVRNRKKYSLVSGVFVLAAVTAGIFLWKEERNHNYSVYCIGDSITYGTGVADSRETDSYPALLGGMLGERYTVYNYGVSGRTLLDNTAKPYKDTEYMEKVLGETADIMVVMLGSNDSKRHNWQPGEFERQYIELVETLQEGERRPEIYLMTPPRAFAGADGVIAYGIDETVVREEVREIVSEVAEKTGVRLIDIYAVTENHPEYFMDGVHPNKKGNEAIAEAVYAELAGSR